MMWAHILSSKTDFQGWPHSHRVRIMAASKRTIYSTLLMRARVTGVFYQERREEFVPLHPKVLVGQENKWLRNLKEKKTTLANNAVKFSRLYN